MEIETKHGQRYVTGEGIPEELVFPGGLDEQTVARIVMQEYGDSIRAAHENRKRMGVPSPMESAVLKAGQTAEMLWDFMNYPTGFTEAGRQKQAELDAKRADRAAVSEYLGQFNPLESGLGEAAPYFAIPAGAGSRPIQGLLTRLGAKETGETVGKSATADMAAQGGLLGAASDEGTALEGAAYAAPGGFLAQALSRVLRPVDRYRQDPHIIDMADRGERLGYELMPSQRTGSRRQQQFEDILESNFFSGGGALRTAERNQANSNRIVAEALGFKDRVYNKVTGDMLDRKKSEFDDRFARLTEGQYVFLDDDFYSALDRIESENVASWVGNKDIQKLIERARNQAEINDGWIDSKAYQDLSSDLSREITSAFRSTSGKASQAKYGFQVAGVKEALDDAAERTIGADYVDAFKALRQDYKTYKNLLQGRVINEETGDVNLNNLANILRKQDETGYRMGRNESDLYEATRFTRAFPGEGVNSLTARRQSIPSTLATAGLMGMMGYDAYGGDAAAGVASAAAVPMSLMLMGRYYNSPMGRRHFGKGLLPPISDEFRRYLGQKVGAASFAAGQQGLLPAIE